MNKTHRVCVLVYDDCQYSSKSTSILGVFATLDEALVGGWKTVIQDAMQPWKLKFYKSKKQNSCRGLGSYTIEQWDMTSNKRMSTHTLGWKIEGAYVVDDLDKYLKEHNERCNVILQQWLEQVMTVGVLPQQLHEFTFQDNTS